MKIRSLLALVGLAIGFTLPTLAQQKDTVDPQIIEQLNAHCEKMDEAVNNNDAAAVAALFTKDGVLVTNSGPIYGREAIEKYRADEFKQGHFSNYLGRCDHYGTHVIGTAGNEVWVNGYWSLTWQGKTGDPIQLKGYWSAIEVREGDAWKTRMQTWNVTPAPAATPSPMTTPSNK